MISDLVSILVVSDVVSKWYMAKKNVIVLYFVFFHFFSSGTLSTYSPISYHWYLSRSRAPSSTVTTNAILLKDNFLV